jgi:hypothetical protein
LGIGSAPGSRGVRILLLLAAALLLASGAVLGYIAVVAIRRSEGVFLPAGYVALLCVGGGAFLVRYVLRL